MKAKIDLADRPSFFLESAVRYLSDFTTKPYIKVDMRSWCQSNNGIISIDLAGSCMLSKQTPEYIQRLLVKDESLTPEDFDETTKRKLYCLNGFRLGRIEESLIEYDFGTETQRDYFKYNYYSIRPIYKYDNYFYLEMNKLIKELRRSGI